MSIKTTLQHRAAAFPFSRPVGRIGSGATWFLFNETAYLPARFRRASWNCGLTCHRQVMRSHGASRLPWGRRGAPAPVRIQWRCGSWPPDVHAGYFSRTAAKARARQRQAFPRGKAPKEVRRTRNGDIRRTDQEMPLSGIILTPLLTRGGGRW